MKPSQPMKLAASVIGLLSVLAGPAHATFREQNNWQFRDAAALNAALAREQARLQTNGLSSGGSLAQANRAAGAAALGAGRSGSILSTSTTIGNMTSGTATVTVSGSNNTIILDGFLNVSPSQTNTGQTTDHDHSIVVGN